MSMYKIDNDCTKKYMFFKIISLTVNSFHHLALFLSNEKQEQH